MLNTIGHRRSEISLQLGKIYNPQQALKIRLVDELAKTDELMVRAEERMKMWCNIPCTIYFRLRAFSFSRIKKFFSQFQASARSVTKTSMRSDTINRLKSQRDADIDAFVESTMDAHLQANLERYLSSLKNKAKN
jgi:ClpP class serine protease